jgi:hypothetical protein
MVTPLQGKPPSAKKKSRKFQKIPLPLGGIIHSGVSRVVCKTLVISFITGLIYLGSAHKH